MLMEGGENIDAEAVRKGVLAAVAACGSGVSEALWLKRFDIFRGMECFMNPKIAKRVS